MNPHSKKGRLWLGFSGLLVALLLAGVFTLGSLNLPIEPRRWNEVVVLYAVSTFIVAAFLVFGLVLARSLLRLWVERRAAKLGGRFKTKMVLGAMAISLLPVTFLFFASYALLNRTLARWFPRPLELATEQSQQLLTELGRAEHDRLVTIARNAARAAAPQSPAELGGADAVWTIGRDGKPSAASQAGNSVWQFPAPRLVRTLPSGAEIWELGGRLHLAGRAVGPDGEFLVAARRMPDDFLQRYTEIESQLHAYELQKQHLRAVRGQMLLALLLFTLLLVFSATWFALFLAKQVTVPIEALADATREITAGHFDHQVQVQAQDELGILVRSFNQMTAQLGESRQQIDEFTRSLQQAVQELERRRKLMETILENIPTGVLSLDDSGAIVRMNPAAVKIFGGGAGAARGLTELMGEAAAHDVQQLMRRSLRLGAASKELEIAREERVLHAAVTVSSLGPRRSNPGFVVVVDDLTELLRAQKAAAWQEVAQRIAHEIKNPLTPIQLSAQRLLRNLQREPTAGAPGAEDDLRSLARECAGLIEREAAALAALVGEFSQFVGFPSARPVLADANAIVASALEIFGGRLEGIGVRSALANDLPPIKADPELLRRALVNLIDNAAEAMEGSSVKQLAISTRVNEEGESVEISVADSGHGISPEDKDRLFLPHFSTKDRGTGLGLAIASRIVVEHGGTIRVEDNSPMGARFVILLPAAEVPAAWPSET